MFINSLFPSILADDNLPFIVVAVVFGILLIAAIIVILYFTVFKRARLKRQVSELTAKYNTSHGLLFGDINTLIKRLETISNLNIIFINDYKEWKKRYADIRDNDGNISYKTRYLNDLLNDRRLNELTSILPATRESVCQFCDSVTELDNTLKEKFKIEDQCNDLLSLLKDRLRQVKVVYNNNAADMNLVVSVFEDVFKRIDDLLELCDGHVEGARYEEAQRILTSQIEPAVNLIQENLKILPEVCIQITNVLPDSISSLKNRFEELTKNGIPLYQACSAQMIQDLNVRVAQLSNQVKSLKLSGVKDEINEIHKVIDTCSKKFDEEIEAKEQFLEAINPTDKDQADVSKEFTRLTNNLPKIKEMYLIDATDEERIADIKALIDKKMVTKRNLDSFMNSATKQPYTVLLTKVTALRAETKAAKDALDEFMTHLMSLKTEVEEALEDLNEYYLKVRDAESVIADVRLASVTEKYAEDIENLHSLFDELNTIIHSVPIDVRVVENRHQSIVTQGNKLLTSVNETLTELGKAEKALVIANRHRAPNPDVDATIKQAENFFFDGNFSNALVLVTSIPTTQDTDPNSK